MKTDILFSSAQMRFSRSQQEAILAWGRDLGAKDVPSLYGLDKFQNEALEAVGNPTVKVKASSGNVFYQNSILHALAQVCPSLHLCGFKLFDREQTCIHHECVPGLCTSRSPSKDSRVPGVYQGCSIRSVAGREVAR